MSVSFLLIARGRGSSCFGFRGICDFNCFRIDTPIRWVHQQVSLDILVGFGRSHLFNFIILKVRLPRAEDIANVLRHNQVLLLVDSFLIF